MPPKEAAPAPAGTTKEQMVEAYARRDQLAQAHPNDPAAIKAQDQLLTNLIGAYTHDEQFDPEKEPVLAALAEHVKRRNPFAARLLLQSRTKVLLYQKPKEEQPQLPDVDMTVNGLRVIIPRGRRVLVPELYQDILDHGEIR